MKCNYKNFFVIVMLYTILHGVQSNIGTNYVHLLT